MYWIVDVIVGVILLFAIIRGIKKGFFGTTCDIFGYFIIIALSFLMAAVIVLLFYKLGVIDSLTYGYLRLFGETNSLFKLLNITSKQVCYYLAIGTVGLIALIVSYIIMMLIFKRFIRTVESWRENEKFKIFDSIIGVLVNTSLVVVVILGVFGFFHAFNGDDRLFTGVDEVLRACPVSSLIYKYNPLNTPIKNSGIAETVANILLANFK